MRVRILEDTAGEFRHYQQGDVVELTDRQAMELLRREVAEAVDLETASVAPSLSADDRTQQPKRRRRKR
jgi:hypothetical protein